MRSSLPASMARPAASLAIAMALVCCCGCLCLPVLVAHSGPPGVAECVEGCVLAKSAEGYWASVYGIIHGDGWMRFDG